MSTIKNSPSIWSIRQYAKSLQSSKDNYTVLFYFDLHAHPSNKNFFIYGNSFGDIAMQTEAQLFGKMIEFNCPYFQNLESIYSEKQMNFKHRNDNYSKEGCARVYMHKLFNIVHSYTVECGYFGPTKLNHLEPRLSGNEQPQSSLSNSAEGYRTMPFIESHDWEHIHAKTYVPECYMLMGKSLLITILDLFSLNPYPKRIKNQIYHLCDLRKSCGMKIYHDTERFKMTDSNSYKKVVSDLTTLIYENYYQKKLKSIPLNEFQSQTAADGCSPQFLNVNAKDDMLRKILTVVCNSSEANLLWKSIKKKKQIEDKQKNTTSPGKLRPNLSERTLMKVRAGKRNSNLQMYASTSRAKETELNLTNSSRIVSQQFEQKMCRIQTVQYAYGRKERLNERYQRQQQLIPSFNLPIHSSKNLNIKESLYQSLKASETGLLKQHIANGHTSSPVGKCLVGNSLMNHSNSSRGREVINSKEIKVQKETPKTSSMPEKSAASVDKIKSHGSQRKIKIGKKQDLKLLRLSNLLCKTKEAEYESSRKSLKHKEKVPLPHIMRKF